MSNSSGRCVYGGETRSKPSHFVTQNIESSSKASISQQNVASYMSEANGGGDPVTALSLRPSTKNTADRRAKVNQDVAAALTALEKTQ
ncbi:hypothetical protein PG991_011909 [Apiospora marii]|uniref:Uncharacterized protein n=1 Tax=Apiospora marii TaxID=335849 RepID=A0ABR1RFK6_9PEZI